VSATSPLGQTTQLGYDNGDLASLTDALGRTTTRFTDGAGRVVATTDPLSVTRRYDYDALNRVTRASDALNGPTTFAYGVNNNDDGNQLTSLTYTLGQTTLGNLTYAYDAAGHRTSVGGSWARTGLPAALSSATYDATNRITTWGGTSFTYDLNGNQTSDGTTTSTWDARVLQRWSSILNCRASAT
jgi:YD repeat-containing protein